MNEAHREQIRVMLLDIIDNTKAPDDFPNHADFKRDWLQTVADVATELAKN